MKTLHIDHQRDLPDAAEEIVKELGRHRIVAFYGPMGAGQTTLIREIAGRLGVEDTVTSPTFALVNQYMTADGEKIDHFDFYRINRIEEVFDLGYEEYFDSGDICLIEWPEKIERLLPEDVLVVEIEIEDEESRIIRIGARNEPN